MFILLLRLVLALDVLNFGTAILTSLKINQKQCVSLTKTHVCVNLNLRFFCNITEFFLQGIYHNGRHHQGNIPMEGGKFLYGR